jgi:hypothetical protein
MKLKDGIVVHVSEEAKRLWDAREPGEEKKRGCPSCEIEALRAANGKKETILTGGNK